jgi:acyl-CoA synthetase (AMP-forming)/AMP-acid ligase II
VAAAELYGDRPAVIDELGTLSFAELDRQARALAGAMYRTCELDCDDRVAIMCRNHRGFVLAAVAASRLGCDLVPVGTDFSGAQLRDVLDREGVTVVVCDDEFEQVFDAAGFAGPLITAWSEQESGLSGEPGSERESQRPTIEALLASGTGDTPAPGTHGRVAMLTSGTTGTPRGATRNVRAQALLPLVVGGLIDLPRIKRTPRSGQPIVVAPPLFHLFGIAGLMAAFAFGSPVVLSRRFDPERTLEQIAEHRADVLLAVPTMLGRIMDMPAKLRDRYDCSSLRMLISGAAPLTPELAEALLKQFGDVLYNGYASTETGAGTIATPADLRAAPGTVGRPVAGVTVKILDQQGDELARGETGRVFVGSPLLFEGYTGGGSKEMIDGLLSTGDLGHLDVNGRLFIDGRDDDMIVSGGENVFPQEVEELLISHVDVADAAVVGVPDEDFGQRLAAWVVARPGAAVSEDDLGPFVRERLARYKVPREITFVAELPRTSTGKLRRSQLGDPGQN